MFCYLSGLNQLTMGEFMMWYYKAVRNISNAVNSGLVGMRNPRGAGFSLELGTEL